MTISKTWIRIGNIGCAVLLLALVALQLFQPFWEIPGCICTEECIVSKTIFDTEKINEDCPICRGYAESATKHKIRDKVTKAVLCHGRPLTSELSKLEVANRDTSKPYTITIQQYIWMPTFSSTRGVSQYYASVYDFRSLDYAEYTSGVEGTDYEFMVKDIAMMPVVVLIFGLAGGFFGLFFSKHPLSSIFGLVTGIFVVKDYLTIHLFRTGILWQLHLGIGIGILLFALIPTAAWILRAIKWCNPKAAE